MRQPRVSPEIVAAACLADRGNGMHIDVLQDINWSAVLKILRANKVPLVGLTSDPALTACPLLAQPEFREAAEEEHAAWDSLRAEYALVRDAFLDRGIRSLLIKSTGLAPSFPYTSDNLDVLVRTEQVEQARDALKGLGYVELRNIEEPQKFLFRKFHGGKSVSAIHLHGQVGWGVPFMDEATVWANSRTATDDPLVLVPSPEDALLITVAHAFYENKSFKLLDLARIRHCFRQGEFDFVHLQQVARRRGWDDGLAFALLLCAELEEWVYGQSLLPQAWRVQAESAIGQNSWLRRRLYDTLRRSEADFPFQVSFILGKVIYYKKVLADGERSLRRRIADAVSTLIWGVKLKLRISGQRGMLVSISGIDGAGKTSHARALVDAFTISEIAARHYWSRSGSAGWLGWLSRRISGDRRAARVEDTATALARRRRRLHNPSLRLGWLMLTLADLLVRYNLQVRLPRLVGGVIVCDRYTYDAIVEIRSSLPDGSTWVRCAEWMLTRLCPSPDISWLLDVCAETAAERQSDENGGSGAREGLEKHRAMYEALARRHDLITLSTSASLEETASRAILITLNEYYRAYGTWINALLLSNPSQMNR